MAETLETRDVELIRRLAAGDDDAFLEFYRRHQGGLYRYAVHMAGRPESAADVVQETFLTLIRQAGKFDEEKGAPAAFLYGIARNHIRKLREKEGRYAPFVDDAGGNHASDWNREATHSNGHSNGNGIRATSTGHAETALEVLERAEVIDLLHQAVLTLP